MNPPPVPRGRSLARRRLLAAMLAGAGAASVPAWLMASRHGPPAGAQSPLPRRAIVPGLAGDGVPPAAPLREKIGQMVLVGFRGLSVGPGDAVAGDLAGRHLGGVVLFSYDVPGESPSRNIESPQQVRTLTGQLRDLAPGPLLIAADQEGGLVARLSPAHGFPETRSPAELGAIDDVEVTAEAAGAMAATLADAGINVNLAPVVDLNVNPDNPIIGGLDRSFSADPDAVTRHAGAFIRAHHDHGVLCTLKHFPGHGSSVADSHLGFVDVTETWSPVELEPFANLIAEGLADLVMTAHVFNADLDPEYPATLSHNTITGVLRGDLGYDGVVVSDDLQMGAITQEYGFAFAVQKTIEAGVDILALSNNGEVYDETIAAQVIDLVETMVLDGVISEARIDTSYARIQALLARLQAFAP